MGTSNVKKRLVSKHALFHMYHILPESCFVVTPGKRGRTTDPTVFKMVGFPVCKAHTVPAKRGFDISVISSNVNSESYKDFFQEKGHYL